MRFSDFRCVGFLLRIALFAVVMLLAGELFFRFVIPAGNTAFRVRDPEFGILLYDTNAVREGLFTSGRIAEQKARWHINNQGWRSGWDYAPPSPARKPVIALIGDSYIAGFHVDERNHLASVLRDRLDRTDDVYTFGEGGAPLSEFAWIARYVARHFDPDVFVFLVGDGDWKSGITNYRRDPRVHQLTCHDGQFTDAPFAYEERPRSQLAKYSAIIRYLTFNADLQVFDVLKRERPRTPPAAEQQQASRLELQRVLDDEAAFLVDRLAKDHPGKQIIFMVDARRDSIYAGNLNYSQVTVARLTKASAGRPNVHVLDLALPLARRFAADHMRFEFSFDDHWNEHGHQVIGESLADFLVRQQLVKR